MKKRLVSIVLTLCMLFTILPVGTAISAEADEVKITVVDDKGNNVTESGLSVKVTHVYKPGWTNRTQNVTVTNEGGGVFTFDGSKYDRSNTQYYTVTATLSVDGKSYSATQQITKDVNTVVLTLEDFVQGEKWVTFDVYYIAGGEFPSVFYRSGDASNYGPSGDNTPLLTINVNVTALKNCDGVVYQENVSNSYHFIPEKQSESDDPEISHQENLAYATKFWEQVKTCMDDQSIKAFEATGLLDTFVGYCLKNQGSASRPDNHCDGLLSVTPPVYVVEMYDHQKQIFGGYTNDVETIISDPISMYSDELPGVLLAYNKHFNQEIDWVDIGGGVWTGSYLTTENGRNYKYNLKITQINIDKASQADDFVSSTGIKYEKKTNTYYVAAFQSETQSREMVDCFITYTDGVEDFVFNDQKTSVTKGGNVVAFTGSTDRENHIFQGWVLEGGDGTILSQDDILSTYKSVQEDITFVAVYTVAPSKYDGTIKVVLNGTYDSATGTVTSGELVDITTVRNANTELYVSADGVEYIHLERTATGTYSAKLLNGTYIIYYYNGAGYVQASNQYLSINNDNRTRYLFFNSVEYDLNGGVGGPSELVEYHASEATVNVSKFAPTKEGYIFMGWKDEDGNLYNSGDLLTSTIGKGYVLTAQWEDAADIYVNVTILHGNATDGYDSNLNKSDVSLDIVFAPDANTPFLETGDSVSLSSDNHVNFSFESTKEYTKYLAINPTVKGVLKDNVYSVFTSKHNYMVVSKTTATNETGDAFIDVVLDYSPRSMNLEFSVKVDETVPENLVPTAAIVKIVSWSYAKNAWVIISQQDNVDGIRKPGVRVELNNGFGTGYYPVWTTAAIDDDTVVAYGYRIVVTAVVYPDGNIVEVNKDLTANLTQNNTDLYTITFGGVTDGQKYGDLNGAYFENDQQIGVLDAVITTAGYNVTFDAMGGKVNGYDKQLVENQYKMPMFGGYIPVRNGGYIFEGWYLDKDYTVLAEENVYLKEDVILYAKWKEPVKIKGFITVASTYEQVNSDGSVTIHKIHDVGLAQKALIILQRVDVNGYTETVAEQIVELDYSRTEFYFQAPGEAEKRKVGYAEYSFDGMPDITEDYRIQVLIPNYNPTFQHEDESLDEVLKLNYATYNHNDFVAEFGDDKVADVNIHAHFEPEEFKLDFSVNAEQIGENFRPSDVEILITYDDIVNAGVTPSQWPVISQMVFANDLVGQLIKLENGVGNGSDYVWVRHPDGVTNYQYGLRVQNVVLANGNTVQFSDDLPFTVQYKAPAYYYGGVQSSELIATLIPNTYDVVYNLNGGSLKGNYPTKHTWSYETSIAGIVPTFDGFKFDGWYLDEELTQSAGDYIDASVANVTKLYAKWIQVMDVVDLKVTINHNQVNFEGGLATNYNKTLYTQLTYTDRNLPANEQVFVDMHGYAKNYSKDLWHNHGDEVDTDALMVSRYFTHLTSEYDYNVNVVLDGYTETEKTVEKIDQADGSTLHVVSITLQYTPDLFELEFFVQMSDNVPTDAYPKSAEVKVLSWYDTLDSDDVWEWEHITQHEVATVIVDIDPETGLGEGSYPVWHWFDAEKSIPYYYRLEVVALNLADGRTVQMNEVISNVTYAGNGYNAEIVVEGGSLPTPNDEQSNTDLYGVYGYGESLGAEHSQIGTLGAVIDVNSITFHSNNNNALNGDTFRTYYPAGSLLDGSSFYALNEDGTIPTFYDIPEFERKTHNLYVFKGWYLDKDSTDRPLDWNAAYEGNVDVYAHWIEAGTVEKEDGDSKKTPSNTYRGFGLVGVQIRDKDTIPEGMTCYGDPDSGLRFVTVLSESLYAELNAISGIEAEYGFVLAKSAKVTANANGNANYGVQYKGTNVNGVDTSAEFSYVVNSKCSGVDDHFNGENYRLYTVVITYGSLEGEALENAYNESFVARAYLRYYDANGLLRVHYDNYEGTDFHGGCSTSFNNVRAIMNKGK